jgi:phage terminase large subunit-like protein
VAGVVVAAPAGDAVREYAEAVQSGAEIAGPWVRLATARHLRDLETGAERGLVWDQAAADHAIEFFGYLRLPEGEIAKDGTVDGKPFVLSAHQRFIIGCLFGWYLIDGARRFRTAYIEMGKGNGKTPLAAGIGLYGILADGDPAAEVYTAGVTRDQANYLFGDARKMALASPAIRDRLIIDTHNMSAPKLGNYMRGVSSEGRSLDQKRVHMALIDEIHEHPTNVVVTKMRAGTKGRRNAMIVEITNAGYDRHSVCWQHHDYSTKVLEGVIENDSWFAYVCALDKGDEWTDEAVWPKVNPNLGVSITERYLREQVAEAQGMPAEQDLVKRLNFCIWTERSAGMFDMERWDAGEAAPQIVKGSRVWLGLDIATTIDIAALAIIAPGRAMVKQETEPGLIEDVEVDVLDILMRYWCPADAIARRSRRDHVPYDVWAREGELIATPGDEIAQDFIRREVAQLGEFYDVVDIGLDPWNSTYLRQRLEEEGATFTIVRQGFATLTEPTKRLMAFVGGGRTRHGTDPVLRWMASNAVAEVDAAGNVKLSKEASSEKVDGIAAIISAIAAWLANPSGQAAEFVSVWERPRSLTV